MSGTYVAVFGVTDAGVVRSNNEDAFALFDLTAGEAVDVSQGHTLIDVGSRGVLMVVSDGMGGEKAGEVASALAIESVRTHLLSARKGEATEAALCRAVEHANDEVVAAASEHAKHGMGATLVALWIHGAEAITAEVGDSRAYVLREGRLVQMTKDQTYIQMLIDRGALAPETASRSQAKNVILQAVGKAPQLVVAQRRLALRRGDRLLLCSDGLHGQVSDDEIRDVLASTEFLDEAGDRLVELANQRGGKDNVTVVVATVAGEGLPEPSPKEEVTLDTIRAYSLGPPV